MLLISLSLGITFIYLASFCIFGKKDFEYLLITLFCLVSPIPFLAYTQVSFIKIYLYLSFFIFIIVSVYKILLLKFWIWEHFKMYFIKLRKDFIDALINNKQIIFISFLISISLLYKTFPTIWRFEAHDMVYYSWLNEISSIDYAGPVRIPTAYPNLLSANHLIAGSLLSPFLIFNNNINIYNSYCIKFILSFLTFFNFIYIYLKYSFFKLKGSNFLKKITPIFIISFLFLIYNSELDYSLSISNYPLIMVILTLTSVLIKYKNNNEDLKLLTFFLSFCFLISKATTFPIILISYSLFICLLGGSKLKFILKNVKSKYIILSVLLIFINFFSWIIPQSNHGSLQLAPPLCLLNTSGINEALECISASIKNPFSGWYIPSFKIDFLKNNLIFSPITEFYFLWIICLLPCFLSGLLLSKNTKSPIYKLYGKFILCYSAAASLGLVLIRESNSFSGSHTFHSSIIAPAFSISAFLLFSEENYLNWNINIFKNLILLLFLPNLFIINFYDSSTISRRYETVRNSSNIAAPPVSITLIESKTFDSSLCTNNTNVQNKFGLFLDSRGCSQNNNIEEIKAALEGIRTDASLRSDYSLIKQWALETEND